MITSLKGMYYIGNESVGCTNTHCYRAVKNITDNIYLKKLFNKGYFYYKKEALDFLTTLFKITFVMYDGVSKESYSIEYNNGISYERICQYYEKAKGTSCIVAMYANSKIDDSYIGDPEDALQYHNLGLTQIQHGDGDTNKAANIGFNAKQNCWYTWNRAVMYICGVGDIKMERTTEGTELNKKNNIRVKNNFEAKESVRNMARLIT